MAGIHILRTDSAEEVLEVPAEEAYVRREVSEDIVRILVLPVAEDNFAVDIEDDRNVVHLEADEENKLEAVRRATAVRKSA